MNMSGPNAVNGAVSADKSSDKNMGWGDLKDAVDEAKVLLTRPNSIAYLLFICLICSAFILQYNLSNGGQTVAANRLFELHETQEDNLILSKQLEDLQVGTFFVMDG